MLRNSGLTGRDFIGKILQEKDPYNQGRYKVHIDELKHKMPTDQGIWCKNQTHRIRMTGSDKGSYGQYVPLQGGTRCIVKFVEEDLRTGYIDRIISDEIANSQPSMGINGSEPKSTTDRDDVWIMFQTPKKRNIFMAFEDTGDGNSSGQVSNSIHLYFNGQRTTFTINEEGIHWYTADNECVTITQDNNIRIKGKQKIQIDGTQDILIQGDQKVTVQGKCDIGSSGDMTLSSGGNLILTAGGTLQLAGSSVKSNPPVVSGGSGKQAAQATGNEGESEISTPKKVSI